MQAKATPAVAQYGKLIPVDKTGFKPKYSTSARNQLAPPVLFTGMWIFNTDTRRPNKYDGTRWIELPE